MVNAEKYRDLIIEIFKTEGMNIGILNNTPYPCVLKRNNGPLRPAFYCCV